MRSSTHKMLAIMAGTVLLAAVLGASLGVAAGLGRKDAGGQSLSLVVGQNYTGPIGDPTVAPATWLSCLPAQSWAAIYTWDGANQQWKHYFNTAKGVPAYVNQVEAGGITVLTRPEGVALIMDQAVANPFFKDFAHESCP